MKLVYFLRYPKVSFKFRVRKFMKLFKSLLVAPATLGLLAPMSASANEVTINDFNAAEEIAVTPPIGNVYETPSTVNASAPPLRSN